MQIFTRLLLLRSVVFSSLCMNLRNQLTSMCERSEIHLDDGWLCKDLRGTTGNRRTRPVCGKLLCGISEVRRLGHAESLIWVDTWIITSKSPDWRFLCVLESPSMVPLASARLENRYHRTCLAFQCKQQLAMIKAHISAVLGSIGKRWIN